MGSNISQHSSKGLKGRRARSSGDLCNGDSKSQTESSVCGSVVGEVMGWNRSLPNHLDGNRHLADYSRVNNNYGELGTYNRCQKGGRGLRYRVSKSGSDAEPVWKLQDSQFDQGYGSERSPEEEYVAPLPLAPLAAAASLEEYEAELRNLYPFITEDNTFTVVVEKDGRGLGMSVCGGAGLVRIRRLYPPQPAWRTGRLAPRDLLLAANGVPLAGLSTYEALEVLRTAATRVELRVCRPPSDALESLTPPDPPTPPVRTPHPPHLPPLDPLNCHPLHAR
ncbi:Tyrosine-protein phosphatase non-receptor type 13 [Papilio machaon]|uniref:Tyrosine-protein phosphatase non-receptor type 13 n=2 Tax=Papilio machaon TaxID=76193 RepID=A0A194QN75_PAPMA|nr:Tyrosine-protein phosphatase non-receptor type 13 [Papilio machaon]